MILRLIVHRPEFSSLLEKLKEHKISHLTSAPSSSSRGNQNFRLTDAEKYRTSGKPEHIWPK